MQAQAPLCPIHRLRTTTTAFHHSILAMARACRRQRVMLHSVLNQPRRDAAGTSAGAGPGPCDALLYTRIAVYPGTAPPL